jgi:hypothetical protein
MATTNTGNSRLAGKAARNCASGWTFSAKRDRRPTSTPIGTQIKEAIHDQHDDAGQRENTTLKRVEDVVTTLKRVEDVVSADPDGDKVNNLPCREDGCDHYSNEPKHVDDRRAWGRAVASPSCNGTKRCRVSARSSRLPGIVAVWRSRLRCSSSRNHDLGAVCAPVCSKRNSSAQSSSGRNINWS